MLIGVRINNFEQALFEKAIKKLGYGSFNPKTLKALALRDVHPLFNTDELEVIKQFTEILNQLTWQTNAIGKNLNLTLKKANGDIIPALNQTMSQFEQTRSELHEIREWLKQLLNS